MGSRQPLVSQLEGAFLRDLIVLADPHVLADRLLLADPNSPCVSDVVNCFRAAAFVHAPNGRDLILPRHEPVGRCVPIAPDENFGLKEHLDPIWAPFLVCYLVLNCYLVLGGAIVPVALDCLIAPVDRRHPPAYRDGHDHASIVPIPPPI